MRGLSPASMLALGAALWAGGCAPEEPLCPGACATLRLSAPELGEVVLDRLEVVVRVGEQRRRELIHDRVLRLPGAVPLAMPEMDREPGQRAALYLRATWDGGAAPVLLTGAVEWHGERRPDHAVPLLRCCTGAGCSGPGARQHAAMAFDPVSRRLVLFGGRRGERVLGDTWQWDGGAWHPVPAGEGPAPRAGGALAWDPQRGRLLLFGGEDRTGGALGDLWEYLGPASGWSLVEAAGPSPQARAFAAFSTAPVERAGGGTEPGVLLFGGAAAGEPLGDTWTWLGRAGRWVLRQPGLCDEDGASAPRVPPCRAGAALALAAGRSGPEALLVGGAGRRTAGGGWLYDERVWRWDGRSWWEAQVAHPPTVLHRRDHQLVPLGGSHLLLLGGQTDGLVRQDAFRLDLGRGLFVPQLGPGPSGRAGAAAALDEERGELLLTGGWTDQGEAADTWLHSEPAGWTLLR